MRSILRLYKSVLLFILTICTSIAFVGKSDVHAAEEFIHKIRIDYHVREDNSTFAEYNFATTNKVSNNYLRSFSLNLPFQPKSISSSGSQTKINIGELKQVSTRSIYSLDIEFPTPIYGLNKSFGWKLTFEVEKFVLDHGQQNAIIIPVFNDTPNISSYEIAVHIPHSFGDVSDVYGAGAVSKNEKDSVVLFKNESNAASSHIILLGNKQEYFFETLKVTDGAKIYLPKTLPYQHVSYTLFPQRNITMGDILNPSVLAISSDEAIKGFVQTSKNHNTFFNDEKTEITDKELLDYLIPQVITEGKTKSEIAKQVYDIVTTSFELNEYSTTIDTAVSLDPEKRKVNPAELNSVFRQMLSSLNIENRGIFGYVFPIQPFQREQYVTEQHVWSEFWDDEKWISVDPTWKISSRGTDYFDNNMFHHVTFGTYHKIDEISIFLANIGLVRLTPVKYESHVDRKLEINMLAYNETYLNKEFRMIIKNTSNDLITLTNLYPSLDLPGVTLRNDQIEINKTLYPGGELTLSIPLEYGIIFKNKEGGMYVTIGFKDDTGFSTSQSFNHVITVRSNLSRYFSQSILIIVIFFVLLSIGSFTLYKKNI